MIGKKFSDEEIQRDLDHWPFIVVEGDDGRPTYQFKNQKNEIQTMLPEQVSAKVLARLKSAAQDKVGGPVSKCVVTVPAYFNDQQRRATQEACQIAGLDCVKILNEPTAAAIANSMHLQQDDTEKHNLIFDFGGGTLDVTILKVSNGRLITLATSGNCHLGGQDIDYALVDHFQAKVLEEHE